MPSEEEHTGTIKSIGEYKKGDEFYDRYFITKVESDSVYFATYPIPFFLLSFPFPSFLFFFSFFPLCFLLLLADMASC